MIFKPYRAQNILLRHVGFSVVWL